MSATAWPPLAVVLGAAALFGCATGGEGGVRKEKSFDLQGHRGARGLVPENTLPAFRRALELGVTTLEMDVVISADAQVVVSHEPWMAAAICSLPSGAPVPEGEERQHNLYRMSYAEIARYDCGRRGHPRFPEQQPTPARKPLLSEVIAEAEAYARELGRPPVFYNIETKSTPGGDGVWHPEPQVFARLLYDVLEEGGVTARAVVQSFDPRTLRAMREIDPSVALALLVTKERAPAVAENVAALGFVPAIYSPNHEAVDAAMVEAVHARGMRLVPWTVNAPKDMRRLRALGVDGLITDYPDRGQRFLAE